MPTRPKKQTKTVVGPRRMGEDKPLFPKGVKQRKTSGIQATVSSLKKVKKMNALDEAISQGKTLPSKNKKGSVPPDYDVIMPGMGSKKPGKKPGNSKIKGSATPVPLPKKPSNVKPGTRTIATKKPAKKK